MGKKFELSEVKVIKADSPESVREQLKEAGLPDELIEQALMDIAKKISNREKSHDKEECDCLGCTISSTEEDEELPEEVKHAVKVMKMHKARGAMFMLFDMLENDLDITVDRDTAMKAIFDNQVH